MTLKPIVSLLALALVSQAALPAKAFAQTASEWTSPIDTPSSVLARHPKTARLWLAIVPAEFRKVRWISRLDGTSSPARIVRVNGNGFALGGACKPHDCNSNGVAFLISLNGRRATGGLIQRRQGRWDLRYFGNPAPNERTLIASELMTYRR